MLPVNYSSRKARGKCALGNDLMSFSSIDSVLATSVSLSPLPSPLPPAPPTTTSLNSFLYIVGITLINVGPFPLTQWYPALFCNWISIMRFQLWAMCSNSSKAWTSDKAWRCSIQAPIYQIYWMQCPALGLAKFLLVLPLFPWLETPSPYLPTIVSFLPITLQLKCHLLSRHFLNHPLWNYRIFLPIVLLNSW